MKFEHPSDTSNSAISSSLTSFYSFPNTEPNIIAHFPLLTMAGLPESQDNNTYMPDADLGLTPDNFTSGELADAIKLITERRKSRKSGPNVFTIKKEAVFLKWNGNSEDFDFYVNRLETRIENELENMKSACSICLDTIDTLPDDKKSQVSEWLA